MNKQALAATPATDLPPGPIALGIQQVCAKVGVSHASVYAWIAAGQFPRPFKIGRRSLWHSDELDDFLRARLAERDAKAVRQ